MISARKTECVVVFDVTEIDWMVYSREETLIRPEGAVVREHYTIDVEDSECGGKKEEVEELDWRPNADIELEGIISKRTQE